MGLAVLHQRVDDRTTSTCLGMTDKEPVLQAQLGWTDRLLGEVIIDTGFLVIEVIHQRFPLSERVTDSFKGFGTIARLFQNQAIL